jgi:BNR repeat-like domain
MKRITVSCHCSLVPVVVVLLAVAALPAGRERPEKPVWKDVSTVKLPGLKVTLSQPVLVARSKGYLWFPTLLRRPEGDLLAIMSNYADLNVAEATCLTAWSGDGGLTWSEPKPALYGDVNLRLPNGDHLLLPYYLHPKGEGTMSAHLQRIAKGKREIEVIKDGVTVSGWPRPDKPTDAKLNLSGFVFNGQTVQRKDSTYLATLYGTFKDASRYSLVVAQSKDGIAWKILSVIADETCPLKGKEGPCETALCRLKDGRLMCVFRLNSGEPFGQSFSGDDGKTWSKPESMGSLFSVQPSLAVLPDGMVVLTGGRPGVFAWFNRDGTGTNWVGVDLKTHHNNTTPREQMGPLERTSSYSEVVALDDTHLLCIYDRIPHGWHAIPAESKDTNSVWVVRLTVEKTSD